MSGLTVSSVAPEWAFPYVQLNAELRCSPDEARRYALELLEQALIAEIDAFLIQEGSDRIPDPKAAVSRLAELRESDTRLEIRSTAQVRFVADEDCHICSVDEAWALSYAVLRAAVLAEQEAILSRYGASVKLSSGEITALLLELDNYRRTLPGDRIPPAVVSKKGGGARVHLEGTFRGIVKSLLKILR